VPARRCQGLVLIKGARQTNSKWTRFFMLITSCVLSLALTMTNARAEAQGPWPQRHRAPEIGVTPRIVAHITTLRSAASGARSDAAVRHGGSVFSRMRESYSENYQWARGGRVTFLVTCYRCDCIHLFNKCFVQPLGSNKSNGVGDINMSTCPWLRHFHWKFWTKGQYGIRTTPAYSIIYGCSLRLRDCVAWLHFNSIVNKKGVEMTWSYKQKGAEMTWSPRKFLHTPPLWLRMLRTIKSRFPIPETTVESALDWWFTFLLVALVYLMCQGSFHQWFG